MIRRRTGRAALLAAAFLLTGQAVRIAACACLPCPLEGGAACRPEPSPEPPCCGEPAPEEACSCAHIDAPEAVPVLPDILTTTFTTSGGPPEHLLPQLDTPAGGFILSGRDPPGPGIPLYLRDLSLRI